MRVEVWDLATSLGKSSHLFEKSCYLKSSNLNNTSGAEFFWGSRKRWIISNELIQYQNYELVPVNYSWFCKWISIQYPLFSKWHSFLKIQSWGKKRKLWTSKNNFIQHLSLFWIITMVVVGEILNFWKKTKRFKHETLLFKFHGRFLFAIQLICCIALYCYFQVFGLIRCSKVDDFMDEQELNNFCLHGRIFKKTWNDSDLQEMGNKKSEDFGWVFFSFFSERYRYYTYLDRSLTMYIRRKPWT